MILNGRRIEQRTQIIQEGGPEWLLEDQRHNGFDPVIIDGRDPAAFAWAILMAEDRLEAFAADRSEEHTSELQSRPHLVCRLLLEKKKNKTQRDDDHRQN